MPQTYPLMLDVSGRLIVIVGGGAVAARKAAGLIECGATRVRCVSPAFDPKMPAGVERVEARYEPRHLDGAGLAFAATDDPDVNAAVVRDAQSRGILVNRADADADDASRADFVTPARLQRGPVIVTVSSGGSPALAAVIRDGIADRWDQRWSEMADAMQTLRPRILAGDGSVPEERRRAVFRDLVTPDAMDTLARGGLAGLRAWLSSRYPELRLEHD
jgi:siroheme synthase-like protein